MRLEANGISFRYGNGPWLFRNVHLSVEPGEIVGITGPSGRGKTTFCKILAGFLKPSEGAVTVAGAPLPKRGYHPVQLVFQHPEKSVNPRWKMEKILTEGWRPDEQLLQLLGIEKEWLTRWPNELSGGELQRFCVARALGPETRFLLADEMTTMLDAITQAQIWQAVLDIAQQRNMAVIVVSHDEKLIQRLCQRTIDFMQEQIPAK
jgi:peptide/nickel transport system ATP-binding protein